MFASFMPGRSCDDAGAGATDADTGFLTGAARRVVFRAVFGAGLRAAAFLADDLRADDFRAGAALRFMPLRPVARRVDDRFADLLFLFERADFFAMNSSRSDTPDVRAENAAPF